MKGNLLYFQARLGGTEGRVKALETQLQQLEAAKKMAEHKLTSVASTLRRIAGIQLDGSVSLPYKLMSPSRRWSPARLVFSGFSRKRKYPGQKNNNFPWSLEIVRAVIRQRHLKVERKCLLVIH